MKQHTVYLAGPISGCTYNECTDWRTAFAALLPPAIECLSPMRNKAHLAKEGILEGEYPEDALSCARGIMTRDFYDCTRADVVVVNFLDAPKVSIGTVMEIAWAYQNRTPLILISDNDKFHDHPMIHEATGFRVETLLQAAMVVQSLVNRFNSQAIRAACRVVLPLDAPDA